MSKGASEGMKPNVLRGEMAKHGITIGEMARRMDISPSALSNKIRGKSEFTLTEAQRAVEIINSLGEDHTLESMFFAPIPVAAAADREY